MVAPYATTRKPQPDIGTDILIPVTNVIESSFATVRHRTIRRTPLAQVYAPAATEASAEGLLPVQFMLDLLREETYEYEQGRTPDVKVAATLVARCALV